jgi:hypothetical protein
MKYFYLSLHPDLKFNYTLKFNMLARHVDVSRAKNLCQNNQKISTGI